MEYYELKIIFPEVVEEEDTGIIVADLGDLGFDSFQQEENILNGYISAISLKEKKTEIENYLQTLKNDLIKYEWSKMENIDWNAVWESNFEPIQVGDLCCVRAPFHQPSTCRYDIVIMPKMSFGTGHHATTYLMIENMFQMNIQGKNGLDMGCGTGILAILAIKLGASFMDAIDIDDWAVENCLENIKTNGVETKVSVMQGDASRLHATHYDFIFANINRNVLLENMEKYASCLTTNGEILFSGFLEPDVQTIVECAEKNGLHFVEHHTKDGWQLIRVRKI